MEHNYYEKTKHIIVQTINDYFYEHNHNRFDLYIHVYRGSVQVEIFEFKNGIRQNLISFNVYLNECGHEHMPILVKEHMKRLFKLLED